MAKHVMVDLETLSKRSDAAITQLAAIAFDSETGEKITEFSVYVFEKSDAVVGHIDVDTVAWWLTQQGAADLGRKVLAQGASLAAALLAFNEWFAFAQYAGDLGDVACVWAHGATFDFPILESAFARCGLAKPWHYRSPRDTRTLYALAPGGMPTVAVDETRKHDALYDCEVQVRQVCGALKALRDQAKAVEYWKEEARVSEEARESFEQAYNNLRAGGTAQNPAAE